MKLETAKNIIVLVLVLYLIYNIGVYDGVQSCRVRTIYWRDIINAKKKVEGNVIHYPFNETIEKEPA